MEKGAASASREFASVGHHHHCHQSEGVSVQSTPCLPSLWHVASFPHARRFSQTWPVTGLDPPSTRSQPPQRTGSSGMCSSSRTWTTKARTSFTPGAGYMVNLLWIQDMSLKDCLLSDHGHGNPGRYDLARSNSLDLTVTRGEPPVQPIETWRLIRLAHHQTGIEVRTFCSHPSCLQVLANNTGGRACSRFH